MLKKEETNAPKDKTEPVFKSPIPVNGRPTLDSKEGAPPTQHSSAWLPRSGQKPDKKLSSGSVAFGGGYNYSRRSQLSTNDEHASSSIGGVAGLGHSASHSGGPLLGSTSGQHSMQTPEKQMKEASDYAFLANSDVSDKNYGSYFGPLLDAKRRERFENSKPINPLEVDPDSLEPSPKPSPNQPPLSRSRCSFNKTVIAAMQKGEFPIDSEWVRELEAKKKDENTISKLFDEFSVHATPERKSDNTGNKQNGGK
ncbi:hypothetical protein BKA69DRAFT_1102330 [Paraphysoderma sedebokerense]|nr:hypothetical protein BKA69DRAFT_1102330 [Paraphysoderma sedebokerense]